MATEEFLTGVAVLDPAQAGRGIDAPMSWSHVSTNSLIATALKHKTSVTFMMCSVSPIRSAGDNTVDDSV